MSVPVEVLVSTRVKDWYDRGRETWTHGPAAVGSREVKGELRTALDADKTIRPVLYEPCRIPRVLRAIQHVDITTGDPNDQTALHRIVQALPASAMSAHSEDVEITATPTSAPAEDRLVTQFGEIELVEISVGVGC